MAVPILIDDTAVDVMKKVTVAAEMVLMRSLPGLLSGQASRSPQRILPGEYFGRRSPEDGRIDWSWPAARIHNLVRAVAPPYPGAFGFIEGRRCEIHRTRLVARPHRASNAGRACFTRTVSVSSAVAMAGCCGFWPLLTTGRRWISAALANVLLSGPRFL